MKICPVCSTEYPDDVKFCPNDGQTLRSAAPANDLVGEVIADRYHVVKKLGEGGMGQVYLAEHVKMGRRSAIKVMNPSMVHDPDAVARFNREASNASRITHPNVCAIYDFGETPDGLIYLAMEFIEGEPLTDLLEREGALPVARAAAIFLQTADALQAAHDLAIVHRDLKPDNIMLARHKRGSDTVKVVDFGIAKAVGGDAAGQKVTKTGLVIGTPEFMSPEQLSGDTLDGRSDLYSLALVFYRMLTGTLPFHATSVQETMIKRLTDEPLKLAEARPDLSFPAGLQPILDTALARNPTDRYQTVAKFAADVAAVTGRPAEGAVPQTRSVSDAEGKTQLLDTTAAGATQRLSARKAPVPAAPKRRSLALAAVGIVVVLGAGGAWMALSGGKKASGNPVDSTRRVANVVRDTAQKTGVRQSGGITTLASRESTHRAANPPPPPAPAAAASYDDAAGKHALDHLVDAMDRLPGQMLVDSVQQIYRASSPGAAKGYAAYIEATLYLNVNAIKDVRAASDWINKAVEQDPTNTTYRNLKSAIDRERQ
ncbi:MAG TPA: serine/threonine-protein kinase [Gemmatimonadales bacterium]|nr:serine/threonine-protein kinase [Gemmatimonadales bacterium]